MLRWLRSSLFGVVAAVASRGEQTAFAEVKARTCRAAAGFDDDLRDVRSAQIKLERQRGTMIHRMAAMAALVWQRERERELWLPTGLLRALGVWSRGLQAKCMLPMHRCRRIC
jgi:hypothetical protein